MAALPYSLSSVRAIARKVAHDIPGLCPRLCLHTKPGKQLAVSAFNDTETWRVPLPVASSSTGRLPEAYEDYSDATAPSFQSDMVLGTGFSIYKGKSAVQFKPIMPRFDSAPGGTTVMQKKGALLMEFANATGQRTYDWGKKVSFALSVVELAEVFLVPGSLEGKGVSLYHDPGMQSESQGQVKKVMYASLMPDGRNVSVSVSETFGKEAKSVNVPVSPAEFAVVVQLVKYLIPRLTGVDRA